MALQKYVPSSDSPPVKMKPLRFSTKVQAQIANAETNDSEKRDADVDLREVYFLIMHFLSVSPCKRTYGQLWNELLENQLLPRRYHAWYSRAGEHSGQENDDGMSFPLSYAQLVQRNPHIETDHLIKLLKRLLLTAPSQSEGKSARHIPNAADVPTLLGIGSFSLLSYDGNKGKSEAKHPPVHMRWPHMHADQVRGLSLREIGGGFTRHHRAPSIRAACYAIAKPSTMVQKMQNIKRLRGHRNAVYCAIFDRSGRYVITGSDDRLVKIWSMETAYCLASCRGHEGDITDLAVSSNNFMVASASNDCIIRVWHLPDGQPISVLRGHTGAVTAIAFSPRPGSVYQLLSSSDDGTCRIWDARNAEIRPRIYFPKPSDSLAGLKEQLFIFDFYTTEPSNFCCAFNANGTVFVTGSSDTLARVWIASKPNADDSDQPIREIDVLAGHENDVNYVQFSGCSVSSRYSTADCLKEESVPKFRNSWFSQDNIVTCSRDGSAIIWIPRSRRSHGKVGRWCKHYHLKVPPPPLPPQPPRGGPRQRILPTPRGVNMIIWSLDNRFVLAAIMEEETKQAVRSNDSKEVDKWEKDTHRSRRAGPESYSRLRDERSYKEALASLDGRREDEYDWVKRSITGIIKSHFDLGTVVKGLASKGIKVKGTKWGYTWNSCIITFGSKEEFEEAWKNRRDEVSLWFDWLDPLMSVDGVPMAFCSVELHGIPLLCCNGSFLEKLVSRWGKLVCIHESTIRREDLAVARALLRVASPYDIQDSVTLGAYGRSYKVKISVGSVSYKQESFFAEILQVAGDGVSRVDSSSEEKEVRSSGGVGSPQLPAENSRDTVDRWLVGDVCTTVAGGSGSKHLILQEGESQPSGAKVSGFSAEDLNFKEDYRGLGLRNVSINEFEEAHLEGSSESNTNIYRIVPSGPAVNLLKLGYGNRLESRVELQVLSSNLIQINKGGHDVKLSRMEVQGEFQHSVLVDSKMQNSNTDLSGYKHISIEGGFNRVQSQSEGISNKPNKDLLEEVVVLEKDDCIPVRKDLQPPSINMEGGREVILNGAADDQNPYVAPTNCNSFFGGLGSSSFLCCRFSKAVEEAMVTWEVCKVLGISFKDGKKAFLDKIINLEEGSAESRNRGMQSLLPKSLSDHNPVSLEDKAVNWGPKPFSSKFTGIPESISDLERKINELDLKAQGGILSKQEWDQLRLCRTIYGGCIGQKKASGFRSQGQDGSRRGIGTQAIRDQSKKLEEHFLEQEIWQAIVSSDSSKAPGPDGFTMGFFKNCWPILKEHVLKFFEDFYFGRKWEHGINHAFITLIPKKLNPDSVEEFRPISLVGSLYKILSKVLSKRLSCCVGDIISHSQFAFIPGRQLLDCAFIANEGIDYWRKKGLKGVAFKVDFRRAYDSVEWPILIRIMSEMGFGKRWLSWISQCISTASISVLVNGSPSEEFHMAKGLRQGCSLSPLLFNIVGELLNLMISKAVDRGLFQGFVIGESENSVRLTHLQFADDLIIFCQASLSQIKNVKRVLRIFSVMTGLHLNLAKSKLFGINVEEEVLSEWASSVGCSIDSLPTDYLGLPLGAKKNSEALWDPVFKNFSSKLAGWKANCLSLAGRTVLLKSVLTSLPIFFLSLFRMPCKIGKKLNSLMASFLWGDNEDKRKIHWVNWKSVCTPLNCGGLGVLDVNISNRALLGKWVWKFANEKNTLWKSVLCCRHKVSSNSMSICKVFSPKSSWIWRGIANNFLKNDSEGERIRSNSKMYALSTNKWGMVAEFGSSDSNGWVWNIDTRRNLCDWELDQWLDLMTKLKDFKLTDSVEDFLSWSASGDGLFSVKSCRKELGKVSGESDLWVKGVWQGLSPPRVEVFLWQLAHQKVAVREELVKRGLQLGDEILCPFCKKQVESVQHLFISCDVVWELWNKIASYWEIALVLPKDPPSLLCSWGELRGKSLIWKFIPGVVFWSIWKARNAMVFDGSPLDRMSLFFIARFRLSKWFLAKYPKCPIQEDVLIGDPSLADGIKALNIYNFQVSRWIPPPMDFLKMNVDGAVRLDGSNGGIGGILRDWNSNSLLTFSENVGQGPPPVAELKAIKRGIEIYMSSCWVKVGRLIVESDCKSAVEWVHTPAMAPVFILPLVKEISSFITDRVHSIRLIPRVCNGEADSLAKMGIDCRICVWNAADGSLVHSLSGHTDSTYVLDVHPFNPRIAMSAGYDGRTIVWDIWEGTPIRIYEIARFKLVDGKFSSQWETYALLPSLPYPGWTSIILSDDVGQLYILNTGQGESQKDAKYDQFFLGDYRPLIHDTSGNSLDLETQLTTYMRNMQDLLCDSGMIPYTEPYQTMYQKRRLGALGLEWKPCALNLSVGPNFTLDQDYQIPPLADLDAIAAPLPVFLDVMDWEPEIEVQSDDNDSEYNVIEEHSTGGEQGSLGSLSGDSECSTEDSEIDDTHKDALRRSKRKKLKAEIEFMTSSGRRVKRRNLDECDGNSFSNGPIRKSRNGRKALRRKSSTSKTSSKSSRPRRAAARNALHFFSKITGTSTDVEEYDSEGDSSESESMIQDSYVESDESDGDLPNGQIKLSKGKEVFFGESEDVAKTNALPESHNAAGNRRRLVLKFPARNPNKLVLPESTMERKVDIQENSIGLTWKASEEATEGGVKHISSPNMGCSSVDAKNITIGRWGVVKARTSKRLKFGEPVSSDAYTGSTRWLCDHKEKENVANGYVEPEKAGATVSLGTDIKICKDDMNGKVTMSEKNLGSEVELRDDPTHAEDHSGPSEHIKYPDSPKWVNGSSEDMHTLTSHLNGQLSEVKEGHMPISTKLRFLSKSTTIDNENPGLKLKLSRGHANGGNATLIDSSSERAKDMVSEVPLVDRFNDICSDNERDGFKESDAQVDRIPISTPLDLVGLQPDSKKMYNVVYRRSKTQRDRSNSENADAMVESTKIESSLDRSMVGDLHEGSTNGAPIKRSSRLKGHEIQSEDVHRSTWGSSTNGSQLPSEEWGSSSRMAVGSRSTRNRRRNTYFNDPSPIRKPSQSARKGSWLMLTTHEEGSRYIPQLGDEIVYLRQGHQEYAAHIGLKEAGPWTSSKGGSLLRAVEFCRVEGLEYSTSPGSGDSRCKMTLKFTDPSSSMFDRSFNLTLPDMTSFPDFIVERTRFDAAMNREWGTRAKCKVWWKDDSGDGGSWWDGRIVTLNPKSCEFPDSPWESLTVRYKSEPKNPQLHSPWELFDADLQWEQPHIDSKIRNNLLSTFARLEKSSREAQDQYAVNKLKQVSQKSNFTNRYPVPLSIDVIQCRLENNYYRTLEAVQHDIQVMLSNAESYFGRNKELLSKLKRLSEFFSRTFSSLQPS
ncbi:bromodomain and WD repeat-containing protein 3-like isoform X4 [Hibiscus syriacus]|uniref:Bromodomain and WD repeat-containing protein 3-like isoform X4 n=1 Tax=Hibiscus syriacus TaxID=106335 RepID=A0A6A2Z1P1_HIBSY|nr:bromodomain and WD repeat-containing protein 3-like isoform X4 [Hibiscus syriacus]